MKPLPHFIADGTFTIELVTQLQLSLEVRGLARLETCPKGLNPAKAIAEIKMLMVERVV